jgi:hypothetical protein
MIEPWESTVDGCPYRGGEAAEDSDDMPVVGRECYMIQIGPWVGELPYAFSPHYRLLNRVQNSLELAERAAHLNGPSTTLPQSVPPKIASAQAFYASKDCASALQSLVA